MLLRSFFIFSAALLLSSFANADELSLKDQTPHITVSGAAHIDLVPDVAILSFAVATERPNSSAAAADNATAAQAVIAEIKAQDIDAKDIRTTSVTLTPMYDESHDLNGRLIKRTLRGYQARNEIEVRVHAIDKAGALAQHLIGKGANNFTGIVFEVEHPEPKIKSLQAEAMKDALTNARSYTDAIGLKLARVIEIVPDGGEAPRYKALPAPRMARMASTADPEPVAIPLEPGLQRLEASVSVTWEIAQ